MRSLNLLSKKGNNNQIRKNFQIPVVMYGKNYNQSFIIDYKEFYQILTEIGTKVFATIFELHNEKEVIKAIVKDIQMHPISDEVVHVDFFQIDSKKDFTVSAKISVINYEKAPFNKEGGFLYIPHKKVKIICNMENIMDEIICDVSNMHKGEVLRASNEVFNSIKFVQSDILVTILDK